MMGNGYMMNNYGGNAMGLWSVFGFITWLLVITFLILGIAYFIKELNKKGKK